MTWNSMMIIWLALNNHRINSLNTIETWVEHIQFSKSSAHYSYCMCNAVSPLQHNGSGGIPGVAGVARRVARVRGLLTRSLYLHFLNWKIYKCCVQHELGWLARVWIFRSKDTQMKPLKEVKGWETFLWLLAIVSVDSATRSPICQSCRFKTSPLSQNIIKTRKLQCQKNVERDSKSASHRNTL